ncbi:Low-specificity L-threonine aldolase [Serendipita indica DSM 11827]|nr:Low-specificity L-threonine aldolase [Serendipita indica DSM 11827]
MSRIRAGAALSTLSPAQQAVLEAAKLDLSNLSSERTAQDAERRSLARDFCSDTVTAPPQAMLEYAFKVTSFGDDVFQRDYCTNALEKHVANLCGKEAGLFISSGTMGNQIALRCLLEQPPYSVLCDQRSHLSQYETGGAAYNSGATLIPVVPSDGKPICFRRFLSLEDVKKHIILTDDIHYATTQVIALENTLNGSVHPQQSILEIASFGKQHGMKMHLDGARLWHVAVETGQPLSELCSPFDTVTLCFSKGLGAPAGSILVGTEKTIALARRYRKLFGGAMRQIGILSACAAYALTHHLSLLPSVHSKAKRLAQGLQDMGISITTPVETCMVWFDPSPAGLTTENIASEAAALQEPITMFGSNRVVVHIQTSDEAIDDLLRLVRSLIQNGGPTGRGTTVSRGVYSARL